MPKLTVDGVGAFEVPQDKRLVLALEDEAGLDQLHACGGQARCTTCRVSVLSGRASPMTGAEQAVLKAKGLIDDPALRLSCQMTMVADLTVRAESRLAGSGRKDAGARPQDFVEPPPVFVQGTPDPQQERPDERV